MRSLHLLALLVILNSCNTDKIKKTDQTSQLLTDFIELNSDSDLDGSILIYDLNHNTYYSNDFNWARVSRLPASTFKIPHSLIALELGIIDDESTIFKWKGEKRAYKIWQQDLTFKQAFHYSCVPCYQEIAHKVGVGRMNAFMDKFNYGQMDIHRDIIDLFWLRGKSNINQFQQIDFLKRLYHSQLPISQSTEQIFKQMFIAKQTDKYTQ
jgi:beta-lactamase class D